MENKDVEDVDLYSVGFVTLITALLLVLLIHPTVQGLLIVRTSCCNTEHYDDGLIGYLYICTKPPTTDATPLQRIPLHTSWLSWRITWISGS